MNRKDLRSRAAALGLQVSTYSPGDGSCRYRFHTLGDTGAHPLNQAYCMGAGQAERWLDGFEAAASLTLWQGDRWGIDGPAIVQGWHDALLDPVSTASRHGRRYPPTD